MTKEICEIGAHSWFYYKENRQQIHRTVFVCR